MPVITPPIDNYPEPEFVEPQTEFNEFENRRVELFLNVNHWKCPKCGLTNFGRNKYCADQRCHTARPEGHVLT